MLTIEYSSQGNAIGDAACEELAKTLLKTASSLDLTFHISSEIFVTVVRALICEGFCNHQDVRFLYNGKYIPSNSEGRLREWPIGFCDIGEKALYRLLDLNKKKE